MISYLRIIPAAIVFFVSSLALGQAHPTQWETMNGDQLRVAATECRKGRNDAPSVRVFADFAYAKFIDNPQALKALSKFEVQTFSWAVSSELTGAEKSAWADRIRTAFAQDRQQFLEYPINDAVCVAEALFFLGDVKGCEFLAEHVNSNPLAKLDVRLIGRAAWCLKKIGTDGDSGLAKLANYAATQTVQDEQLLQTTSVSAWRNMVWMLHQKLGPEQRLAWGKRLRNYYAGNELSAAALSTSELSTLLEMCGWLGDADARGLIDLRNSANTAIDSDNPVDLWRLVHIARNYGSVSQESRESLVRRIISKYTTVGEMRDLEWLETCIMSFAYGLDQQDSMKKSMAERAYQKALGTPEALLERTLPELTNLCWTMQDAGLFENGGDYARIAEAIAVLSDKGKLDSGVPEPSEPRWLGIACRASGARSELSNALVDDQKAPRYGVCQIISWAYCFTNEYEGWLTHLDEACLSASDTSDLQAKWLLCRAYAQSVRPVGFSPLAGKRWIRQAMVTARSEDIKEKAVKILADGYAAEGHHELAYSLIQSIESQFTQVGRDYLAKLKSDLERDEQNYLHKRVQIKARCARNSRTAWTNEMLRRLDQATSRGDTAEVKNIQTLLGLK